MSQLYEDILQGFREIGEIEGNHELVKVAQDYIDKAKEDSNKDKTARASKQVVFAKIGKKRIKDVRYIKSSDEVDDVWESYDPFHGHTYRVTGGYDDTKYTNYPKNAIEYWFKLQKKNPSDVAIMCKRKEDAQQLVEWAANNIKYLYQLNEKWPTPYKIDYIVKGVEDKAADGCKYFYEGEYGYGDMIFPFDVG